MVPCAILDDVMIRNLLEVVFSLHHRLRVDKHTEIQKSRAGLPRLYTLDFWIVARWLFDLASWGMLRIVIVVIR